MRRTPAYRKVGVCLLKEIILKKIIMEYTFKRENKESTCGFDIEKVLLERWVWGVVYKATEAQIKQAEATKITRDEKLRAEMCEKEIAMINEGKTSEEIQAMFKTYKLQIATPVPVIKDELHQFDSEGTFHQFKEIELDRVELFTMYRSDDINKRYDIVVTEGMQLFHFYRHVKPFYLDNYVKVYVFGWKSFKTQRGFEIQTPRGEEKDGVAHYHFILPDDRMILSDVDNVDLPQFNLK